MAVRIQIMSDLHLETPRFLPMYTDMRIEARAPYLALLGDIGHVSDIRLFEFLERQLRQFKAVLYVLGNHEPYQRAEDPRPRPFDDAVLAMQDFEAAVEMRRQTEAEDNEGRPLTGRFVLLNCRRLDLSDSVTVLGCTLFSHISEPQRTTASMFVSDFSEIAEWSVDAHNAAHREHLAWLNREVEEVARAEPQRRVVILTHHSPTTQAAANSAERREDARNVQSAFVTDMSGQACWTSGAVRVWAFGHTHDNCDFVDGQTNKRVVANQRGYGREDAFDFDPDKVLVV